MAHPYHLHREHQVSHRRVAPLLKDEASGATKHSKSNAFSKVTSKTAAENHNIEGKSGSNRYARGGSAKHSDEAQDRKLIAKMMKEHERKEGEPGYARGGKVKGNTTNIIIASQPKDQAAAPMAPPMAGPPPGGPPMGPPPGMPMRASGGKVGGESTKGNLSGWSSRAAKNSYAKGGKVGGGTESGVGRLQHAKRQRGK